MVKQKVIDNVGWKHGLTGKVGNCLTRNDL